LRADDEGPVKLIVPAWGITSGADGSGLFNELFRFVAADGVANYQIDYVNYEEALRRVVHGQAECVYPVPIQTFDMFFKDAEQVDLIESLPVFISKSYIFSRPGEPVLARLEDMRDMLLIQILGENYNHDFLGLGARFLNVETETEKIKLLLAGRGHAMIGSVPDILYSFKALGVEILPYNPDFSVLDYPNNLTCRASARTKALVDAFSARIKATFEDGSLKAFIAKQGVPLHLIDNFLAVPAVSQ